MSTPFSKIASSILGLCVCMPLHAAEAAKGIEYKVLTVRIWEIDNELNKWSREGWKFRSMTTSSRCIFVDQLTQQQKTEECQVVVLEREK